MASERGSRPVWCYLSVQALLFGCAVALPPRAAGPVWLAVALLGMAALLAGIRRYRPAPPRAWWLLTAGTLLLPGAAVGVRVAEVPGTQLLSLSFVLLVAGLALLARGRGGSATVADVLDSALLAVGGFLVLWTLVLHPMLDTGRGSFARYPLYALLVLFVSVRLVFSLGLSNPALRLLLLGLGCLQAATVAALIQAYPRSDGTPVRVTVALWAGYHVLLGAAALHPSVRRTGQVRPRPDAALSWRRTALCGVLAVAGPTLWLVQQITDRHRARDWRGQFTEAAAAGVLALLLVARLALVARVAQRRSAELGRRTAALAEANLEQQELQRQLTHRALHDPLTGLANRVVLGERMEQALAWHAGTGRYALLLLDLDGFKDINDTMGHPVGDELLRAVAHRLRESRPRGATLARLGGDEFAVFLEDVDARGAIGYAAKLLDALRQPFRIAIRDLFVTTSIGLLLADATDGLPTPSGALRDADLALYAAKDGGKNRIAVFAPELRQARIEHIRLAVGLRRALANGELSMRYQPMTDADADVAGSDAPSGGGRASGGTVVAVRALVRWVPPDGSAIPPVEFIPVAEETGLIGELGAWVLRQSCVDAREWYAQRGVSVLVNVSGRQLLDPDFGDIVFDALAAGDLPGAALILEITDTSLSATSGVVAAAHLGRLREHGVRVAITRPVARGTEAQGYPFPRPVPAAVVDDLLTVRVPASG